MSSCRVSHHGYSVEQTSLIVAPMACADEHEKAVLAEASTKSIYTLPEPSKMKNQPNQLSKLQRGISAEGVHGGIF